MKTKKSKNETLNQRQTSFCLHYLTNGNNATEAARKAGYTGNETVLGVTGFRLLRNPKIQTYIKTLPQKHKDESVKKNKSRQLRKSSTGGQPLFSRKTKTPLQEISMLNSRRLICSQGHRGLFCQSLPILFLLMSFLVIPMRSYEQLPKTWREIKTNPIERAQLAEALKGRWTLRARPEQLEPTDRNWNTWLIQCGLGWGKTRTA